MNKEPSQAVREQRAGSADGGFDAAFVHYFDKAPREIVQKGDVALCGVVATSTRNANNKERQARRCPICAALLNTQALRPAREAGEKP